MVAPTNRKPAYKSINGIFLILRAEFYYSFFHESKVFCHVELVETSRGSVA